MLSIAKHKKSVVTVISFHLSQNFETTSGSCPFQWNFPKSSINLINRMPDLEKICCRKLVIPSLFINLQKTKRTSSKLSQSVKKSVQQLSSYEQLAAATLLDTRL